MGAVDEPHGGEGGRGGSHVVVVLYIDSVGLPPGEGTPSNRASYLVIEPSNRASYLVIESSNGEPTTTLPLRLFKKTGTDFPCS